MSSTLFSKPFLLLTIVAFSSCTVSSQEEVNFLNGSKIILTSIENAKSILNTSDAFTQSQSAFDFASKTQNKNNSSEVDYLNYASDQALSWTNKEKKQCIKVIESAKERITSMGLQFILPDTINLIKSTCKEEGSAEGYTRQDYIVLKDAPNEHLFLHELFHIISRYNPELKEEIYATLGFLPCKRIEFPQLIREKKITNPDAPFFDHFITISVDGKEREAIITTMSNGDYESGSFFKYIDLKLMLLIGEDNKQVSIINGAVESKGFNEVSNFFEQIGKNTAYNIHPEEICAEHFVMLVLEKEINEPKYIQAMKELMIK